MLTSLKIKGFALIDDLELPFSEGLTVLTGETGAGKSIIVDALQAVLGDRVDAGVVRTGESAAAIEAVFTVPPGESDKGGEGKAMTVRREIRREGKGKALVDGAAVTLAGMREATEGLVDLHGQHEHQVLLNATSHLLALDAFAGLTGKRVEHALLFGERARITRRLHTLEADERDRAARQDYLRFVVDELQAADLKEDEEVLLHGEQRVLSSAERLLNTSSEALEAVYQADGSLADGLARTVASLEPLVEVDSRLEEPVSLLEAARSQIEEAAHLLRDYTGRVQTDPRRLEEVEERLALVGQLKKKYGPDLVDVLERLRSAREELRDLEGALEGEGELRERERELTKEIQEAASQLRRRRKAAAADLEKRASLELADLAMEKIRFSIDFEDGSHTEHGMDQVEFLFSPNPGEPVMPLRRIASGGELSRVMLALKRILAGADAVPTLVFDEVDAGIGGRVAAVLGRKLREIAGYHQVLCITHLAQVAAYADHHVLVEKKVKGGRSTVQARLLDKEGRVGELARMMGGLELSAGILRSARELLEEAHG